MEHGGSERAAVVNGRLEVFDGAGNLRILHLLVRLVGEVGVGVLCDLLGLLLEAKTSTMAVLCISVFSLNSCIEVPVRLLVIFHMLVDIRQIEVVVCIGIVQLNGLQVLLHCLIELAQVVESQAKILVVEREVLFAAALIDLRLLKLLLDGVVVGRQCVLVVACFELRQT